jgi:hypothetical protein
MQFKFRMNQPVYFDNGVIKGNGFVVGCALTEQAIVGATYIVKVNLCENCTLPSEEYPFDTITVAEAHLFNSGYSLPVQIGYSKIKQKWFVFNHSDSDEESNYLHRDKIWRNTTVNENGEPTGYFDTKEGAEEIIKKLGLSTEWNVPPRPLSFYLRQREGIVEDRPILPHV